MIVGTPGWSAPFEFKTTNINGIAYIPLQLERNKEPDCDGCHLDNKIGCSYTECTEYESFTFWKYKEVKEIING